MKKYSRYILYKKDEQGDNRFILYSENEKGGGNRPTVYEARRYHNLLEDMMESPFYQTLTDPARMSLQLIHDVLCWTLGHDNNPSLEKNLGAWVQAYDDFGDTEEDFSN